MSYWTKKRLYSQLYTVFKYVLIKYLDRNDTFLILGVSDIKDLDVAILLGINLKYECDYAFRYASEFGHLPVVQYLLERGADIHTDDDYALRYASKNGHLLVVKYLVENGADIHAYDDYSLGIASENGDLLLVHI